MEADAKKKGKVEIKHAGTVGQWTCNERPIGDHALAADVKICPNISRSGEYNGCQGGRSLCDVRDFLCQKLWRVCEESVCQPIAFGHYELIAECQRKAGPCSCNGVGISKFVTST